MPETNEIAMKARVAEILNRHAAVGLAVGVVRNGSLEFWTAPSFLEAVASGKVGTYGITETAPS